MTDDQIDVLLTTVEQLKHIEVSLTSVRELTHHESEAWTEYLAARRREWLKHVATLSEIVGSPKAIELASRFSTLAKPV
jgi:hypothetical protein